MSTNSTKLGGQCHHPIDPFSALTNYTCCAVRQLLSLCTSHNDVARTFLRVTIQQMFQPPNWSDIIVHTLHEQFASSQPIPTAREASNKPVTRVHMRTCLVHAVGCRRRYAVTCVCSSLHCHTVLMVYWIAFFACGGAASYFAEHASESGPQNNVFQDLAPGSCKA
jgi:hypothetical protein